jgi:hypothetical protein
MMNINCVKLLAGTKVENGNYDCCERVCVVMQMAAHKTYNESIYIFSNTDLIDAMNKMRS